MSNAETNIDLRILETQIESYCVALPATVIAQSCGGIYLVWALWPFVDRETLFTGAALLSLLMISAVVLFRVYRTYSNDRTVSRFEYAVIAYSFVNGSFWGLTAITLYPAANDQYAALILVLLSILPFVPIAAMAGYLPGFFSYLIPVAIPFIVLLAADLDRPGLSAAILFTMLIIAAARFAFQYNRSVNETSRLRFELEQQKNALEQANLDKATFMASASHDLRQPLHTSSLLIEALGHLDVSTQVHDIQQRLQTSSNAMYELIDGMMNIAKLDAGAIEVELQSFAIGAMLQRLAAEYLPLARERGLSLSVVPTSINVLSDRVLLEQLLRNYLTNAIRYTKSGGIVLGCRRQTFQCSVQVIDTGIGIDTDNIEKIFREFVQLQNPERDRRKGIGLGLSNAKRIAALLSHPIKVSSRVDRGSVFSVQVPIVTESDPHSFVQPKTPNHTSLQNRSLLVIDDEVDIRDAITTLAGAWGSNILAVDSGEHAVQQISEIEFRPDFILADYRLRDGQTGIQAIETVRDCLNENVPAVVISGDTGPEVEKIVRSAELRFIHKPIRAGHLKEILIESMMS